MLQQNEDFPVLFVSLKSAEEQLANCNHVFARLCLWRYLQSQFSRVFTRALLTLLLMAAGTLKNVNSTK